MAFNKCDRMSLSKTMFNSKTLQKQFLVREHIEYDDGASTWTICDNEDRH